jgi:hypothetical protein
MAVSGATGGRETNTDRMHLLIFNLLPVRERGKEPIRGCRHPVADVFSQSCLVPSRRFVGQPYEFCL